MTWYWKSSVIRKVKIKIVSISGCLFQWKKLERWIRHLNSVGMWGQRKLLPHFWECGPGSHSGASSAVLSVFKSRRTSSYTHRHPFGVDVYQVCKEQAPRCSFRHHLGRRSWRQPGVRVWGTGGGMWQMHLWSPGPRDSSQTAHPTDHPGWGFKTRFWVKTEKNRICLTSYQSCKLKI